jgi:hypothetical protein
MKVIVPHMEFRPDLARALVDEGINPRFVATHEPDGYWRCLLDAWAENESFIVLEGDKHPTPGALAELWECPHLWCVYPVSMRDSTEPSPYPALACAKFDSSLMLHAPLLMEHVGEVDVGLGEREWSRLDMVVAAFLSNLAVAHYHDVGRVAHHHDHR